MNSLFMSLKLLRISWIRFHQRHVCHAMSRQTYRVWSTRKMNVVVTFIMILPNANQKSSRYLCTVDIAEVLRVVVTMAVEWATKMTGRPPNFERYYRWLCTKTSGAGDTMSLRIQWSFHCLSHRRIVSNCTDAYHTVGNVFMEKVKFRRWQRCMPRCLWFKSFAISSDRIGNMTHPSTGRTSRRSRRPEAEIRSHYRHRASSLSSPLTVIHLHYPWTSLLNIFTNIIMTKHGHSSTSQMANIHHGYRHPL